MNEATDPKVQAALIFLRENAPTDFVWNDHSTGEDIDVFAAALATYAESHAAAAVAQKDALLREYEKPIRDCESLLEAFTDQIEQQFVIFAQDKGTRQHRRDVISSAMRGFVDATNRHNRAAVAQKDALLRDAGLLLSFFVGSRGCIEPAIQSHAMIAACGCNGCILGRRFDDAAAMLTTIRTSQENSNG